jgi:hypothetical protein
MASVPVAHYNSPDERRRVPRVDVVSDLYGHFVALDLYLSIRDISPSGFSALSHLEFPVGCRHTFMFSTADGRQARTIATCRHSHALDVGDGRPTFLAGFEFSPMSPKHLMVILDLVSESAEAQPPASSRP